MVLIFRRPSAHNKISITSDIYQLSTSNYATRLPMRCWNVAPTRIRHFGGGCPANFIAGEKLSALAGMHRVCRDPNFLGSARPAFGYNLLATITIARIIIFIIISSVILFVSREDSDVGFAENDAEEAIV